jgi:hypothetical protein
VKLQTCRRHPRTGRFLATCSGCTQELHDMQTRNQTMALATRVLATLPGYSTTEITDAKRTRTGHLIIASEDTDPRRALYAIDVFRPATNAETNPDQTDPRQPGSWVLVDQWETDDETEHAAQTAAARAEYSPRITPEA